MRSRGPSRGSAWLKIAALKFLVGAKRKIPSKRRSYILRTSISA
jgi:hypothetical protein